MKIIVFILFPLISFAQTQFPDTLFLVDGRSYPCFITSFDGSRFYFNYLDNRSESIVNKALEKVYLESFGIIYQAGEGFVSDKEAVNKFIDDRSEKIKEDQEIKKEMDRLANVSTKNDSRIDSTGKVIYNPVTKFSENKKWSFGILYVPYYSGSIYQVYDNGGSPPNPIIYVNANNQVNMEAQLAYGITENVRLTFDAGYTSSLEEDRYENHYSSNDYESDDGYKSSIGLKLFDFNLGMKYYFKNIIAEEVSIFAAAGFGKQIAFAQNEYKQLFQEPLQPVIIDEDNIEEFTEELNSPWHFNLGFGAEYFFSRSLSLKSNIRIMYSSASGNYNSRFIYGDENNTHSEERTVKNFITRIGLGLNFYF